MVSDTPVRGVVYRITAIRGPINQDGVDIVLPSRIGTDRWRGVKISPEI